MDGNKKALLISLMIVWIVLGIAIAPFISLFWGIKIISNKISSNTGRYLSQTPNLKRNYRKTLGFSLGLPVILIILPFLSIFAYLAIGLTILLQISPSHKSFENASNLSILKDDRLET